MPLTHLHGPIDQPDIHVRLVQDLGAPRLPLPGARSPALDVDLPLTLLVVSGGMQSYSVRVAPVVVVSSTVKVSSHLPPPM